MPKNTIEVNLRRGRLSTRELAYYDPVLIYKTDKIKIKETTLKYDPHYLDMYNFETDLGKLEKANGNDDEFQAEQNGLINALGSFFASGDQGLRSVQLMIYKEADGAKNIKKVLENRLNLFNVFINTYKKDDKSGGDGLTIYKDDYTHFELKNRFYVFATKEDSIKQLFNNGGKAKDRIIVVHSTGDDEIHLRFISQYLHQASSFHAVNPYGIRFSGVKHLTDGTLIGKLRTANINFYSLLNEEGLDGVYAFKEGVTLEGQAFDEIFTYDYIRNECIKELIRIWDINDRRNSKICVVGTDATSENVYTASIECLLQQFKTDCLIADFEILSMTLTPSPQLKLIMNLRITYNHNLKSVLLNIDTEDITGYLNRIRRVV